jgi:hypothetical protein
VEPLITRLTDVDPNAARPGWVALVVVLALAVATFLLWRNMGKQMRKINFEEKPDADRSGPSERTEDRTQERTQDKQPEGNGTSS